MKLLPRDTAPRAVVSLIPSPLREPAESILRHVQHGTFQRSLSLMVAGSSAVSAIEVGYEHYRGSYSNPVMYTPVLLSAALSVASIAAVFSRSAAQMWMRYLSFITLADGVVGFGFHIRGVARKPGGWRMPVVNIVMGPPLFAPLLFGTAAYLGVIASYLQREKDEGAGLRSVDALRGLVTQDWREDIRIGRFQKHLCVVTKIGTLCCGGESWYSLYKDNFKYRVQWSPIVLTLLLAGAVLGLLEEQALRTYVVAAGCRSSNPDGFIGTGYHIRGILRRPAGRRKPLYNTLYGPPIFAPCCLPPQACWA